MRDGILFVLGHLSESVRVNNKSGEGAGAGQVHSRLAGSVNLKNRVPTEAARSSWGYNFSVRPPLKQDRFGTRTSAVREGAERVGCVCREAGE